MELANGQRVNCMRESEAVQRDWVICIGRIHRFTPPFIDTFL